MNETYNLDRLVDLLQIPPDRLDAFMVDLRGWLDTARAAKDALGPIPMQIGMKWVDDGENDFIGYNVKVVDAD